MTADPLDDPVGVRLAQLLRPRAVADVESRRPRRPSAAAAAPAAGPRSPTSRPARATDRRPSAGRARSSTRPGSRPRSASLTAPRDAVEAGREVQQRRAREPLVAAPARRLVHRDVDLHLAAAVAEAARRRRGRRSVRRSLRAAARRAASASRRRARRRTRRSSRRRRAGLRSRDLPRRGSARRPSRSAARRLRCARSWPDRSTSFAPPPFGTGIPPSWSAQAITCVMKPDTAWSGPSPVCSTHGASRPRVRSVVERLGQPVTRRQQACARRTRRGRGGRSASRPCGRARDPAPDQSSVPSTPNAMSTPRHELVELLLPRVAELGDVRGAVGREERARAVREGARRSAGQCSEYSRPSAVEIRLQLGIGRRADPQRVPGGEDLVREPGRREAVDGLDRAAQPVVSLEHADAPTALSRARHRPRAS